MQEILGFLAGLRPWLVYAVLGGGAALENVFPPVPADTFVLLGGFLAGLGRADPWTVFAVTWAANVASALLVFWAGHRYGRSFFAEGWGRYVLSGTHLRRIRRFYDRWGPPAIFFSRFLPGLRAVVPAFAGISRQRFLPVALPVSIASGIWYGALVWVGATAGRNLDTISGWVAGTNRVLLVVALVVAAGAVLWWYRIRAAQASQSGETGREAPGSAPGSTGREDEEDGR